MASPFQQFKTNTALEAEGVWLDFGGWQIKAARAGGSNKRYLPATELHFREHKQAAAIGVLPEGVARKALYNVYADAVILGWRTESPDAPGGFIPTLEGPDGEPMEFTRENVIKLFELVPDVFNHIKPLAENYATFQRGMRDETIKN